MLVSLAGRVAMSGRALSAFEVVDLDPGLRRMAGMQAVMAFAPINHSEVVHVIGGTSPPTVIAWLVPLHGAEATLAHEKGWEALFDYIEKVQPDLLDLKRRSLV